MDNQDLNEVRLNGILVDDPNLKYTTSSKAVCNFTLLTTKGEYKAYHKCVAWEELAEQICECKKDSRLKVLGRLQTRSYEKDNVKRYITEVIAEKLSIVEKIENQPKEPPQGSEDDLPF
jgi:single-strand DNA-binding protein